MLVAVGLVIAFALRGAARRIRGPRSRRRIRHSAFDKPGVAARHSRSERTVARDRHPTVSICPLNPTGSPTWTTPWKNSRRPFRHDRKGTYAKPGEIVEICLDLSPDHASSAKPDSRARSWGSGSAPRRSVSIRAAIRMCTLGYVDIDNRGVAGMERYLDEQGVARPSRRRD